MRARFLALLLMPTLALCQSITLQRHPKVGEIAQYKATFVFTIYGNDFFYTAILNDKVTEVEKDGSYVVQTKQTEIRANNGQDFPVSQNAQVSSTVYDGRGRVIELKGDDAAVDWRIAYLSCFILPDKPIAKGETWTATLPAHADRQIPGASIIYTCQGMDPDPVDGYKVVRIDEKYAENTQSNRATKTGTIWVNPKTGMVVKVEEQWRNTPIAGISTLVNGNVAYERVNSSGLPDLSGG